MSSLETPSASSLKVLMFLLHCSSGYLTSTLLSDSLYSDILTLKSLQDRTFGFGVVEGSDKMLFMNSEVLMEVDVNIEKIGTFSPEYVTSTEAGGWPLTRNTISVRAQETRSSQ